MSPLIMRNRDDIMKTWLCIAAFMILAVAGEVRAQGSDSAPKSDDAKSAPTETTSAALEEKYAKAAREKIETESARYEESKDSLFWGIASFVSIAAILGIFALIKTQNQAKEIARLRAELEAQK